MRILRRLLRYLVRAVAVLAIVLILAVGATQTGWFKDWVRRYIVREAAQYLDGELRIGRLSGNLFYGVRLSDIALVQNGETIIALKDLRLDYSAIDLISSGIVLDEIELNQPRVIARRTDTGWNLMHLVKRQAEQRQRRGPARPITLPSIIIHDGQIQVDRGNGTVTDVRDLDVQAGFAYKPVEFTVDIGNISFRATDPSIALSKLSGRVAVAGDDIHIDNLLVRTTQSEVKMSGVVRQYKMTPQYEMTLESPKVTFSEVGVILPAVRTMQPQPSFRIKTSGPLDRLQAVVDIQSPSAGVVQGTVTIVGGAPRHLEGDVQVTRLNLGPWLNNKQWEGVITGRAQFDLRMPDARKGIRLGGTYHFAGPQAGAFGYAADNVDAQGSFDGAKVVVDKGRGHAYGGDVTASGTLDASESGAIAYTFKGRASHVDMRLVPKQLEAIPRLVSNIDADYELNGLQKDFKASALIHPSTVEGATIAEGTRGYFEMKGRELRYGGDGHITNLDLPRMGRALDLPALTHPRFEGRINGQFTVDASGRGLADTVLTAKGVATETTLLGARFGNVAFDTRLDHATITSSAKGDFTGLNPTVIIPIARLDGELNGTVDGTLSIEDLRQSITMDTFGFAGTLQVKDSTLFGLTLASAAADTTFAKSVATIRQLTVDGPDVAGTATGTLALDRSSASDLTYRFTVPDLARVGKRVEVAQPLAGSADLGGKVTGNGAELTATGTAHVKAPKYGETAQAEIIDATYTIALPELDTANVRAKGHIDATNIKASGQDVPKLTGDVTYADHVLGFEARAADAARTLDAAGRALLQEGRQEVHLTKLGISTKGVTWQMPSAAGKPAAEAVIVNDGKTINITNLHLENGSQQIAADGFIGVPQGSTSTLKIVAEKIDLAQVAQLVGTEDPRLSGLLDATGSVSGNLQQPSVDAQFAVTQGAFRDVKYESLGGHAAYDHRRLTLDVRLEQSPGTALTAKGSVPVSLFMGAEGAKATGPNEAVDLHVQSTPIDLALVEGLTTAVTDVTGTVQLDMNVKGMGRDVAFQGYVKVDNGAFSVASTGAYYTGLATTLNFEPTRLVIDGLKLIDDGGDPLEVKGVLGLTGTRLGALDLTMKGKAFELLDNDYGEVDVDMDLRVTGELIEPHIDGDISIARGRVEVDTLLRRLTTGAYATESAAEAALPAAAGLREAGAPGVTPPTARQAGAVATEAATEAAKKAGAAVAANTLNRLHLDLHVIIPDNMVLRGKDLRVGANSIGLGNINVTVGGDVRVLRQPKVPTAVVGTVNTVRGTYDFRGRRFDILRDGRIAFQQEPTNPSINVTGERRIEPTGVTARIRIEGTARQPRLNFSSDPPMDESDVIALIVFNRPLSALESGERASIAEFAGTTAAGFIVSPLADTLGRALDLDIFEVGTTTDTSGGTGGVVTAGKQINENLFFRFRQQFGGQEVSEFILEYQLRRFLRLQASAAEGEGVGRAQRSLTRRIERGGVDLIFYFSY